MKLVQQKLEEVAISTPIDGNLLPPNWTSDDRFEIRKLYYSKESLNDTTLTIRNFNELRNDLYERLSKFILAKYEYRDRSNKQYELYEIIYDLILNNRKIVNNRHFCKVLFESQKETTNDSLKFQNLKLTVMNINIFQKIGYLFKLLKKSGMPPSEIHEKIKNKDFTTRFKFLRYDNVEKEVLDQLYNLCQKKKQVKENSNKAIVITNDELKPLIKKIFTDHIRFLKTSLSVLEKDLEDKLNIIIRDKTSNQGGENVR